MQQRTVWTQPKIPSGRPATATTLTEQVDPGEISGTTLPIRMCLPAPPFIHVGITPATAIQNFARQVIKKGKLKPLQAGHRTSPTIDVRDGKECFKCWRRVGWRARQHLQPEGPHYSGSPRHLGRNYDGMLNIPCPTPPFRRTALRRQLPARALGWNALHLAKLSRPSTQTGGPHTD